jgi:FtsP/CotA-like multicopper oxidase with cupredoxin domain
MNQGGFMTRLFYLRALCILGFFFLSSIQAAQAAPTCPQRPSPGSTITDPPMVRAKNGVIGGTFTANFDGDPRNRTGQYCLMYSDGVAPAVEAPVLRLAPGERIGFLLSNQMPLTDVTDTHAWNPALGSAPCSKEAVMRDFAANLHFHGTNVKPDCGSDEVITTAVQPGATWQYNFALPLNDPPGLDWYHPHVHGIAQEQMLGGMSSALVIDAPNEMPNVVGGLRERILVVRDQELEAPLPGVRYIERPIVLGELAKPLSTRTLFDGFGQPASNSLLQRLLAGGTVNTLDGGVVQASVIPPWKDLSVNWVPVKFGTTATGIAQYAPPGIIQMEGASEFWRVANISADSYIRLQVRVGGVPQIIRIVGIDGIPISSPNGQLLFEGGGNVPAGQVSTKPNRTLQVQEVLLPPGGRAEFIVAAPAPGLKAELVSLMYETNADANPFRVLAAIQAPAADTLVDANHVTPFPTASVPRTRFVDPLPSRPVKAKPDHVLYFSQSDDAFFITEDASTNPAAPVPAAYSMRNGPNMVVPLGSVQEWRIENRALEAHAFHIHQVHFRVLKRFPSTTSSDDKLMEFALRDSIDLPAWSGVGAYPSVTIRLYFNDADIGGNFVYHCHILEHEDNGMMGIVRIGDPVVVAAAKLPKPATATNTLKQKNTAASLTRRAAPAQANSPTTAAKPVIANFSPVEPTGATMTPTSMSMSTAEMASQLPVMRDRFGNAISQEVCTPRQRRKNAAAQSAPQASTQTPGSNAANSGSAS